MWRSLGQDASSDITAVGGLVDQYETHKQVSHGSAAGTELASALDSAWNTVAKGGKDANGNVIPPADPNDDSVRAKFLQEQVEPALAKFKEGFTTEGSQAWAEQFSQHLRSHISTKSAADMTTNAGIAAVENVQKTTNNLASMVSTDPSSLDFALGQYRLAVHASVDSSPMIDNTKATAIKADLRGEEAIVKAAIVGMIQKNPNTDLDAVQKKYGEYIKGDEMKMFQRAAQTQAKADLIQTKQLETYQRQQKERAADEAFTKSRTNNISADDNGKLTINPKIIKDALDITRKYPEAGSTALDTTIKFVESQQNKELKVVDDPVVKSDLMTRMFSADKPTTTLDLMKARAEGKISDHTFQAYRGLVQELEQTPLKGPVWHDTNEAVKAELVLSGVGLPGKDIAGEGNYAKWAQTFIPQYIAKSRAGTLEPNALDVKDPNSLISKSMEPFKRSVQQRAQDYLSVLSGPAQAGARKVGDVPVPAALGGIADLQYNKATGQWRDRASNIVYDASGKPVAQ